MANGKAPAHRSHGHKLNVQVMEHESEHPKEVAHYLTDYRNDNMQLARRVMGRQEAFNLNLRLKNTGFAWAVKTGY